MSNLIPVRLRLVAVFFVLEIAILAAVSTRTSPPTTALNVDHEVWSSPTISERMRAWTDQESTFTPATAATALPPELQSAIDRRFGTQLGVITPTATGATIDNPAHQVTAVIDGRGLRISGSSLAVQAWGRDHHDLIPAYVGTVITTADRVVVRRPGLHEIITTSAAGLRHDVVVEQRPPGAGDLVVEIGCHGGRFETKNAKGAEVVINGRRMTYDRLQVSDADGKELVARMEVVAGVVRVHVQDADARYPVVVDPTISATGSLATARSYYTATLLPSGKVLVAGGRVTGNGEVSSCELYDPDVGTWAATGSLATARAFHTATLLPSGKVLLAGGFGGNVSAFTTYLSSCELYDPSTGTWTATGSLATPRSHHTATRLSSGKVLVAAGGGAGSQVSCELYDPGIGTWSTTGSLAAARHLHTATLLPSGEVLVIGGYDGVNYLPSCERYDPVAGTWSATGFLATVRNNFSATLLPSGKVLVTGGRTSSGNLASCELYDPSVGTWSWTGSLAAVRSDHTATLLPSGKVLVTGGYTGSGFMASCELYDPSVGTWAGAGFLATARFSHTATLLPSGKVLVVGGHDGTDYLASCELYDLNAGMWAIKRSMASWRLQQTATLLLSGNVLVTAGVGGPGVSTFLASCELYDLSTDTWAVTGSLANERYRHTATLLPSGKVLVTGGTANDGTSESLASCELYDPTTGTWTATGSLATARAMHTATCLPSGKVLVAGGYRMNSFPVLSCELYDPSTGTWTTTGSLTAFRSYHTETLLPSGKVLVTGGYDGVGESASCELYDPSTGTWAITGSLITGRGGHTATLLPSGSVLAVGGSQLASCELYDPTMGTWIATGSMATARSQPSATLLSSGKVLVAGGNSGLGVVTSCELYDPGAGAWYITESLVTARCQHTATLLPLDKVLVTGGLGESGILASCELYSGSAAIAFTAPTSGSSWSTTLTNLPIAGTATHPSGVLAVTYQLSGATSASGMASGTTAWNFTTMFNLGTTTITVIAEATDGSLLTETLTVIVTSPPTIVISSPTTADAWVSTGGGLSISGAASGSATVTDVTYALSGATTGSGSATGTTSWTFSPALNPGITVITMTATDINDHTGQDAITITRDLSDPVIAISSPVSGGIHLTGTARVAITGTATDDGGITSVSYALSGATVGSGTATGTTAWSLSTPSLNHGTTIVTITARDVADRTSVVTLDLLYPTTSEVGTGSSSRACGFGSGVAAMLSFAFLALARFRRQSPSEHRSADQPGR